MNYQATMEFIGRTNKFGSILGLDNIRELLNRLGNPQDRLKIVHIAGTNGKGSTLAFLASVFKEQGYEAGRYVSPASFCYEEKFRIFSIKKWTQSFWKQGLGDDWMQQT